MSDDRRNVPPRATDVYAPSEEGLLSWMIYQFAHIGNLYTANIYGSDAYFVNELKYIETIMLRNWRNYSKNTIAMRRIRLLTGNGIITNDGNLWKSQRRLIQPLFHHDVIAGLTDVIVNANASLLKNWERAARNGESVNVTQDINAMVFETVLVSIFGQDYPKVASEFKIITEERARNLEFAGAFSPLRKVVAAVAAERRTKKRVAKDILGLLMEARDKNSRETMPDDSLVTEVMTLIVAGYETTSLTLIWTWYLLSKNVGVDVKLGVELKNRQVDELRERPSSPLFAYARQVLDETLRLYPPVWLIVRKALNGDYLGDYFVPARTEIYFSPYIIQRSPALWEAPDRFDPDRFDPNHSKVQHALAMVPFGAGPRNCVGEGLARFEMQIHLIAIAQRLRLRYDNASSPELETGVNLRPKGDFIMFPEIR